MPYQDSPKEKVGKQHYELEAEILLYLRKKNDQKSTFG